MAVDAEEAGMDAFMDKPFKLEELTAVYVKLLEIQNQNQGDQFTCLTTRTPGDDTDTLSLGTVPVARRHRSIRSVTPSAKIFIDAGEWDDIIASHGGGDSSLLEQGGISLNAPVVVAVPERKSVGNLQKTASGQFQISAGSNSGDGMIGGITHKHAKVHAEN